MLPDASVVNPVPPDGTPNALPNINEDAVTTFLTYNPPPIPTPPATCRSPVVSLVVPDGVEVPANTILPVLNVP